MAINIFNCIIFEEIYFHIFYELDRIKPLSQAEVVLSSLQSSPISLESNSYTHVIDDISPHVPTKIPVSNRVQALALFFFKKKKNFTYIG